MKIMKAKNKQTIICFSSQTKIHLLKKTDNMKKPIIFSIIIFLCLSSGYSATYYVSNNGNNANSGSNSQPFKTITYTYSKVVAGDVIIVKPGIYTDYNPYAGLDFYKNGTAANPITIKSQYKW